MAGRWDEEDWSMQLAAMGAVEVSMHDLNSGAPESVREQRKAQLAQRRQKVMSAAGTRSKATMEELKERNKKAYEARRKRLDEMLPAGWKRVESRSRPGEYVYENEYTEERQAWYPTEPAIKPSAPTPTNKAGMSEEQKEKNRKALEALKEKRAKSLPEGWKMVPSNSRPGEYVYENIYTDERIAWFPTEAAKRDALPEQTVHQPKEAIKAKVMFEFTAGNEEEIDLFVGDLIIVEYQAATGWWVGTNVRTGQIGLFPGGFVEVY